MDKLLVHMTGLCAFVPRYEIHKRKKNNQMRVLLVESNSPSDLPGGHALHAHEPHVPVLLCPCESLISDSKLYRKPDMIYGGTAVFYLDDQDLKIKDARAERLKVVLRSNAGSGCPNGRNNDSFEWVTSLAAASPDSEKVPDSCFGSSEVDSSVIARVELREGRISTEQLACDSPDEAILWEFKPPYSLKRGRHHQVAADIVRCDIDVKGTVELVTSPLRERLSNVRVEEAFRGKTDLSIGLRALGKAKIREIHIWVKNMPWADVLGTREPRSYAKEPDLHFSHFYKLSSSYKNANVPHACGRCPVPIPHMGNPNCQPARTAPNIKA